MPGDDIVEATRVVFGELPELPHLPELPERGPGADMIGRAAALLVELPIELYASQWRLAARPGVDLRRARDFAERDLDALTEQADSYQGPLKIQSTGPWTLAATLDLPVGGKVLRDRGAVRDVTAALAEGLTEHLAQVRARVPGAAPVLQLDEPMLPSVLAGAIPTESGLHRYRPVAESYAEQVLSALIQRVDVPVVIHCCAPNVPIGLLRGAGASAVSLDLDLLGLDDAKALDMLGEALDSGVGLFAGAVPTAPPAPESVQVADRIRDLWRRFGFPADQLPEQVVLTPACGLVSAAPDYAREAMTVCREAASRLADNPG